MAKKIFKVLLDVGITICIAVISICGYNIYEFYSEMHESKEKTVEIYNTVKETGHKEEESGRWVPTKDTYNELHTQNSDYVGYLLWDNDLISEPILQGVTNQTYIRSDFNGNYDVWGSIFLESGIPLDSDNLMIYGHSLAGAKYDNNKFSQLQNMLEQDFYESNKTFKIYWENSITSYEVITADCFDTSEDGWNYTQCRFIDEADKANWVDQVRNHTQIQTDLDYSTADKYVTFQTCHDDYSSLRYVVVAKQVNNQNY